jgi:hypothetical protein
MTILREVKVSTRHENGQLHDVTLMLLSKQDEDLGDLVHQAMGCWYNILGFEVLRSWDSVLMTKGAIKALIHNYIDGK